MWSPLCVWLLSLSTSCFLSLSLSLIICLSNHLYPLSLTHTQSLSVSLTPPFSPLSLSLTHSPTHTHTIIICPSHHLSLSLSPNAILLNMLYPVSTPPLLPHTLLTGKLKPKSVSPQSSSSSDELTTLHRVRINSLHNPANDSFSDDEDELLRHITATRLSDDSSDAKSRFNRSWIKYVKCTLSPYFPLSYLSPSSCIIDNPLLSVCKALPLLSLSSYLSLFLHY